MKGKSMGGCGWRPVLGTLAVGVLALAVSLRLEGAPTVPVSSDAKTRALKDESARPVTRILQEELALKESTQLMSSAETVRAGSVVMPGIYPVDPPIEVNYLDDEGTRGRNLGLFTGPMPKRFGGGNTANVPDPRKCVGGTNAGMACSSDAQCPGVTDGACVSGACVGGLNPGATCTDNEDCFGSHCGCTFAIDCEDLQPCTVDRCAIDSGEPFGSGKCVHDPVPNGQDHQIDSGCTMGLECGGCNDHLACNGVETCQGGSCVSPGLSCPGGTVCNENGRCAGGTAAGRYCREDTECPGSTCNHCQTICTTNSQCDDGLLCNGAETCNVGTGLCQLGTPPCGPGATCGEKRCSQVANNPWFCSVDGDCTAGGTCSVAGPICLPGRCCSNDDPQPVCSRRALNVTLNPGAVASCNSVGGEWFAGTNGNTEPNRSAYNVNCPTTPDPGLRCPKYGDGIAPQNAGPLVGPVTDGYFVHPQAGVPLNKLGDDYRFTDADTNPLTFDGHILLDEVRWIGGRLVEERISFEFYDEFGNFIEDLFVITEDNGITVKTIRFSPPLEIPGRGFLVLTVASQFAPDTRFYWATTDSTTVDVGFNDPNVLWVNNGPTANFLTGNFRNLAFELVGRKTAASIGACCVTESGPTLACDNQTVPWTCEGQGGVFLGSPTFCSVCIGGSNTGNYCRSCSNDLSQVCQRDSDCGPGNFCINDNGDCPGGTCVSNATCEQGACCRNQCVGGSNDGNICSMHSECPGGECRGVCTEQSFSACAAAGGSFQGFGTTCDHDGGYGATGDVQSCCPQPVYSGGDNCEDAFVHVINVPPPGSDPAVVTITGDNSNASSTVDNPDSSNFCAPTGDPEADGCWWEAFSIDACAYVRIDTCCTGSGTEIFRPAWAGIFNSCPSGAFIGDVPNPHSPLFNGAPEPSFNRGLPYCQNDNIWFWFGPLGPGTYYYPVYSALLGYHGVYQMHITAMPCPTAACCIDSVCQELNEVDCPLAGGYYQGPPLRFPAVSSCVSQTCQGGSNHGNLCSNNGECPGGTCQGLCSQGSCCTGPGTCVDRDLDPGVTETECEVELGGQYHGGITCFGGKCTNDPTISCNDNAQCSPGLCDGGQGGNQALAQPTPCPICDIVGSSNCQAWDNPPAIGSISDRNIGTGLVAADDFRSLSNEINTVCVWGIYLNGSATDDEFDCSSQVTADNFHVRVFDDFEGLPCNVVGESPATSVKAVVPSVMETLFGAEIQIFTYGYKLTLTNPITGLDASGNTVYWLEVSNAPTNASIPKCTWFWQPLSTSSAVANNYSAAGVFSPTNAYPAGAERIGDYAFCLNGNLTPGQDDVTRQCCNCGSGTCSLTTLTDCQNVVGIWDVDSQACGACPTGAPPNDLCSSTVGNDVPEGTYFFDCQCAGTDGPNVTECTDFGSARLEPDVWYRFCPTVECNLTVSMCQVGTAFDSMVGVYFKPGDPNYCPPPGDASFRDGCIEDESCTGVAVGGAGVHTLVANPAQPGECYVIRVGGFNGGRGSGSVDISCEPTSNAVALDPKPQIAERGTRNCGGAPTQPLQADPSGVDKVRYLSFIVPPPATAAGETAIQVTLVDLMNPQPPNLPGFPPPNFSAFEGQKNYVTAPANCQETESPQTFFKCASLSCTPAYVDWNAALGGQVLHVYGTTVVPSSTYELRQLPVACQGNEANCAGASAPLVIKTQRWGDLLAPFQDPGGATLTQPNISDVAAAVDKFKQQPAAVIVARADMGPALVNNVVNIADVANIVDAFKNFAYPFAISLNCP